MPEQEPPQSYLEVSEVAELAEVSPETVRRWADQGHLVPDRLLPSGRRQYRPARVRAFLRSLETKEAAS